MPKRVCLNCNKKISIIKIKRHPNTNFCENKCYREFAIKKRREQYPCSSLPSDIAGSISLYKVTVDLYKKGYHVFLSASRTSPFDLVISNGKVLKRIEVTTGNYTANGKLCYPTKDKSKSDHIIVVVNEKIIYLPEL
jgi:hypothetical protein